ncbi:MAG: hypothetical protein ACYTG0_25945 [Planctomycetota bacterium]
MEEVRATIGNNGAHISVGYGDPMRFLDRRGTESPFIKRGLVDGRLPIAQLRMLESGLEWNQTVFAHLLDRKPKEGMSPRSDDTLVVHSVFKLYNLSDEPRTAHLWLYFGDLTHTRLGYKTVVDEEIDNPLDHKLTNSFGILSNPGMAGNIRYVIPNPEKGRLRWHDQVPLPAGLKAPLQRVIEWEVEVGVSDQTELRLLIPYGLVDRGKGERILSLDSEQILEEVRDYWEELLSGPSRIETPDKWFTDYAMGVAGHTAQQIGYRPTTKLWMYKTSPNHYERFWLVCGATGLPSLDLRGLTHITRPVLQEYINTQGADIGNLDKRHGGRPERARSIPGEGFEEHPGYFGNFGEWVANPIMWGHGLAIWNLAAHYRITRDRKWLGDGDGSPLQAILKGCDWLATQRRRTMREESGKRVPQWGLLPAASAHDWLAGHVIINDAWCIFGMAEAVRMLREIDHPEAEEIARELKDYRKCLREAYEAARDRARPLPLDDGRRIPFVPRAPEELDWATVDWTYSNYGTGRAVASGALDPNGELADQFIAFMEAGLPRGEGRLMARWYRRVPDTADDIWYYADNLHANGPSRHWLWRHYVEYEINRPTMTDLFLRRDDLGRFFEAFFNSFAVIDHPWKIGAESIDGVPACAPGEDDRWRVIRNMLVNERGGYDGSQQELFLLQAIPRGWLKPGDSLSCQDMGTHLGGHVDLDVQVADNGMSVQVDATVDVAVEPSEVRMRLRSGHGGRLVTATINGKKTDVLEKDVIKLPAKSKGVYRITARFE